MKKVISSLLVAMMALGVNSVKADNISLEEAREAAAYFMGYYTGSSKLTASDLELVYQIDNKNLGIPASYFFNVGDDGWVIMAGTTTIDPIIGYSTEGELDPTCFPSNMMWWVNGYSEMVSAIQELDAKEDYPDDDVWIALKTKTYKGDTKEAQHVLMSEKWGQGSANNATYNYYCPDDVNGNHAVVGCVATAMAQIFHYFRYPDKGQGTASYRLESVSSDENMPHMSVKYNFDDSAEFDYSLMPNAPTDEYNVQRCTNEEMREVARLSYAAGVTVRMDYTPSGSATQSAYVPGAAHSYFKYKSGTLKYRNANASNNDWKFVKAIRTELMGKAILYMAGSSLTGEGADAAGHAWVCGGYMEDDTNKYFMNWGWNGKGNGFYNLGKNSMRISFNNYNFNQRQSYITGMVPPDEYNRFLGIYDVDPTLLGSPYPNPASQTVNLPYNVQNASDLVIYNVQGRPVATYRLQAGVGELVVDVAGMPSGLYIFRVNSQSGKFIVK